jgi:hypothetical protein
MDRRGQPGVGGLSALEPGMATNSVRIRCRQPLHMLGPDLLPTADLDIASNHATQALGHDLYDFGREVGVRSPRSGRRWRPLGLLARLLGFHGGQRGLCGPHGARQISGTPCRDVRFRTLASIFRPRSSQSSPGLARTVVRRRRPRFAKVAEPRPVAMTVGGRSTGDFLKDDHEDR